MKNFRFFAISALSAATLAACSSVPNNAMLDQARSDYRAARANGQTQELAPAELKQAGDALARADAAQASHEDASKVNQLAYLARQRVALAQEAASRKGSEAAVAQASAERDRLRLTARTQEADAAALDAAQSKRDASTSKQQAERAQRDSAASQQLAGDAERRNQALETQLRELNAKKTDRGMVITISDVLFDTDQSQLKSGGMQGIERLGGFLKQYPQRKAAIEGYTDSTGSDSHNMALSGRRADAVMTALVGMGVGRGQLTSQGYGETHPVAGNDNAGGRQMNRRVEIVLSDESGEISAR